MAYDPLFNLIEQLILCHSPSGWEQEIDQFLFQRYQALGVEAYQDKIGNIIVTIPGQQSDRAIAITGHKDEIGMMVHQYNDRGQIKINRLGGSYPWVYGEGVVDILGDRATVSGILSFGSRHVSHSSPQKSQQTDQPLLWEHTWIETLLSQAELEQAGVRAGSRVVIGKHRKRPLRLKDHIGGYTLDNKASLAILLLLAEQVKNPVPTVHLVASTQEEVGALGALYFSQNQSLDALIALEIIPLSQEYAINPGAAPVILSQDAYGLYDERLNGELVQVATESGVPVQRAIIQGFGSDASIAMKFGHVCRGACLGFPTENTHGYEIAHLGAIANCAKILERYCHQDFTP